MKVTRRNSSHGNFHFYPNDKVEFGKSGQYRIQLKGLGTVRERIRYKHLHNSPGSPIAKLNKSNDEWQDFNRSLQSVIDKKLQELEQ